MIVNHPGFFIVFEGIDGCGKSTQIELLTHNLQIRGNSNKIIKTRQPGGTEIGLKLRELFFRSDIYNLTSLFVIMADKAQHVEQTIKPALNVGKVVICDRYTGSSFVYQSESGFTTKLIDEFNTLATSGITPDLTIVLDIIPSEAIQRIKNIERAEITKFDEAKMLIIAERRKKYIDLYKHDENAIILAGDKPVLEIGQYIYDETKLRMKEKKGFNYGAIFG